MAYTPVTAEELASTEGLDDWRFVLNHLRVDLRAGSFPAAASLASAIADLAEAADHHPDLAISYPDRVRVVLTTHAAGGVTTADVDLARQITSAARDAGADAETAGISTVEIAIDTIDADRIRPFWAAALGYRDRDGVLVDPLGLGPPVWFQPMDAPRPERNRIHLDVSVPHDVAESRVAAVLDAGGRLVSDEHARAWWVLADADGNEVCISTWLDR